MPNKWLHGNGHWCAECRGTGRGTLLDRIEYSGGGACQFYARCSTCGGERRLEGDGVSLPAPTTLFDQTIEYK